LKITDGDSVIPAPIFIGINSSGNPSPFCHPCPRFHEGKLQQESISLYHSIILANVLKNVIPSLLSGRRLRALALPGKVALRFRSAQAQRPKQSHPEGSDCHAIARNNS